jgi:biotin-dependent carboxylase-like uncharacterized protein
MSALRILQPGLCTTVQDRGRFGHQRQGVPVCGALDPDALAVANLAVGNPPDEAALELLAVGPTLEAMADSVRVALAGTAALKVDGTQVLAGRSLTLRRGQVLTVGAIDGFSAVLAVAGGLAIAPVLGSRSTCLKSGFGGWLGRALIAGDVLPLNQDAAPDRPDLACPALPAGSGPIRVVAGPQDDHFTEAALAEFFATQWRVARDSDRMGTRLGGPKLIHRPGGADIVSDGIAAGSIQVPGSGQPIVLLADRQTVGGYPKIATVIGADLWRFAPLKAGDGLRFAAVTLEQAGQARAARQAELTALRRRIVPVAGLHTESLLAENLISGVVADL